MLQLFSQAALTIYFIEANSIQIKQDSALPHRNASAESTIEQCEPSLSLQRDCKRPKAVAPQITKLPPRPFLLLAANRLY